MSRDVEVKIIGATELSRRLNRLGPQVMKMAASALQEEAEIEMTEAKERTPVRYGVLRASGTVELARVEGKGVSVRMFFGGAAKAYAIHVHENLEAFHRVGQAKFLESVVLESRRYMAARVARRLGMML